MASYYVYSGAGGAGTGADWANAYTTIMAAVSGKAQGDIFYIAHDHDETTAAFVGVGSPERGLFLCVNRAGSVPPVAADLTTGAQIKSSGDNRVEFSPRGAYFYGITFISGVGSSGDAKLTFGGASVFERCHGKLASTAANEIQPYTARLINTTLEFGSTGSFIRFGQLEWKNTPSAIVGATIPTSLMQPLENGRAVVEGVDLSAVPSGKSIYSNGQRTAHQSVFKDCKLASGVTACLSINDPGFAGADFVRCDSSGTNYRNERYHGVGTQTTETTVIRTGGASDGVTPISWKIITDSGAVVATPFESMPISVWNEDTGGTKTITVEGIWGGGAVPDTNDIWIEVEYLGDASSPRGSFVSSGVATILTTASSYASSSETWGGSTTKFKMSATTGTIQQKGPITVRVYAGLASSTFYICPKVTVA